MRGYPASLALFEKELSGVRDQLGARLKRARALFEHAGNKGSYIEDAVRDVLRQFLPRELGVGHGEVIDVNHHRSSQLDVVVATKEHPNWYRDGAEPSWFLIEGVAAVAEVKSVLTLANLRDTLAKAVEFRKLTPERQHTDVIASV